MTLKMKRKTNLKGKAISILKYFVHGIPFSLLSLGIMLFAMGIVLDLIGSGLGGIVALIAALCAIPLFIGVANFLITKFLWFRVKFSLTGTWGHGVFLLMFLVIVAFVASLPLSVIPQPAAIVIGFIVGAFINGFLGKQIAENTPFIRFIGRRLIFLILTFIIFLSLIFVAPRLIPGNPIMNALYSYGTDPKTLQAVREHLEKLYGLNTSIETQFFNYITGILRGDFGLSISKQGMPVTKIIFTFMPWSLGLLIPAALVSWIIGNLLGALAAYRRKTAVDNALLPVFLTLSQTPYYWLGMILVWIFAVTLGWFPSSGAYNPLIRPGWTWRFIADFLWHYTLPFFSIVIAAIGGWAIGMRSMVVYELGADYVGYSDSLGLPEKKILRYVFKNSMLPQVTGLALNLGTVLGGAIIVELVFSYPGIGYQIILALSSLDFPLIQSAFIFVILTLLIANFIVDLVYAYIDPRIRTGYVGE